MKSGAAIAGAIFTSPAGPAVGAIYFIAANLPEQYQRELENNAWTRQLGYQAIDPTFAQFFWQYTLPVAGTILLFGTVLAVFGNLLVGVPVTLLAHRVFSGRPRLAPIVCVLIGAALGAYLWSEVEGPNLAFDVWRSFPGVVTGTVSALAMVLFAGRLDRAWLEVAA